jgi:hypothetical protein
VSVALGKGGFPRVPLFPECHGLLGTRVRLSFPSATLGEEFLTRVPDIWHSGKPGALGEFSFSRSAKGMYIEKLKCLVL